MNRGKQYQENEKAILQQVGARIRAQRLKLGFTTAEDFANHKNIARTQYHRYEQGQNLQLLTLKTLADKLETTVSYLTEGI